MHQESPASVSHARLMALVHGGRWFYCPEDSSALIVMVTGQSGAAEARLQTQCCAVSSSSGFTAALSSAAAAAFAAYPVDRHHVDLDRTLGVGDAVTNLLCTLYLVQIELLLSK